MGAGAGRTSEIALAVLVLAAGALGCGGGSGGPAPGSGGASGANGGSGGTGAADSAVDVGASIDGPAVGADAASDGAAADVPTTGADAAGDQPAGTVDGAGADAPSLDCSAGAGSQLIGAASVLDRKTCLLWQRLAGSALLTNKQAAKYCDGLLQDGFADWRVPAPEELVTWPNLTTNPNAYITNPTYIPVASAIADGCTGNAHSCNITEYNAGTVACAWQGVGFAGPTVCVRGTATPGTTVAAFAASACAPCKDDVGGAGAAFKVADCLPYAP